MEDDQRNALGCGAAFNDGSQAVQFVRNDSSNRRVAATPLQLVTLLIPEFNQTDKYLMPKKVLRLSLPQSSIILSCIV
tara:strand:- start:15659 stop:15892 length:234 start_codon:yes stop_codon:yes gene_type:complete